jgi:uncharacterized protein (DUF1330 family)
MMVASLALFNSAMASRLFDDYMTVRTGTFTTQAQAAADSRYGVAIWHIAEIWSDDDETVRWIYVESWMKDADAPYLQRVSSIHEEGDGTLRSRRYTIADASRFLGVQTDPAAAPPREAVQLAEVTGCDAVITRAGAGRFESSTTGNRCGNTYKGAAYAISRSSLHANGMTNWDRGFSSDGSLVWGPEYGGYRFLRDTDQSACVQPVRMLVYGDIFDRSKFGAYGRAIAESQLYPETGGYYEAISPPLEVFEGDPPDTRGVIIVRFPCIEAAREFWYSETYQEQIRPLRKDIAEFEVTVLRVPPLPDYIEF